MPCCASPVRRRRQTFLASAALLFPGQVYDTKFVAEFHQHEVRSFLSYLYRKR